MSLIVLKPSLSALFLSVVGDRGGVAPLPVETCLSRGSRPVEDVLTAGCLTNIVSFLLTCD